MRVSSFSLSLSLYVLRERRRSLHDHGVFSEPASTSDTPGWREGWGRVREVDCISVAGVTNARVWYWSGPELAACSEFLIFDIDKPRASRVHLFAFLSLIRARFPPLAMADVVCRSCQAAMEIFVQYNMHDLFTSRKAHLACVDKVSNYLLGCYCSRIYCRRAFPNVATFLFLTPRCITVRRVRWIPCVKVFALARN